MAHILHQVVQLGQTTGYSSRSLPGRHRLPPHFFSEASGRQRSSLWSVGKYLIISSKKNKSCFAVFVHFHGGDNDTRDNLQIWKVYFTFNILGILIISNSWPVGKATRHDCHEPEPACTRRVCFSLLMVHAPCEFYSFSRVTSGGEKGASLSCSFICH